MSTYVSFVPIKMYILGSFPVVVRDYVLIPNWSLEREQRLVFLGICLWLFGVILSSNGLILTCLSMTHDGLSKQSRVQINHCGFVWWEHTSYPLIILTSFSSFTLLMSLTRHLPPLLLLLLLHTLRQQYFCKISTLQRWKKTATQMIQIRGLNSSNLKIACNIRNGTSSSAFPLELFLQWESTWKCSLSHGPQRFQSGDECLVELQSPSESKCFLAF